MGENGRKRVEKANQAGGVKGRLGIRTCSSSTVAQRMQTCTPTAHRLVAERASVLHHLCPSIFVPINSTRAGHRNRIRLRPYTIRVIDGCKPSRLRTVCSTSQGFNSTVTVS